MKILTKGLTWTAGSLRPEHESRATLVRGANYLVERVLSDLRNRENERERGERARERKREGERESGSDRERQNEREKAYVLDEALSLSLSLCLARPPSSKYRTFKSPRPESGLKFRSKFFKLFTLFPFRSRADPSTDP